MATEKKIRHYVQTFQRLKNQYTAWAGNVRATRTCASLQGHVSNDAIGNALFMWAREQDAEKLAKMLEPYIKQFREMWEDDDLGEPTSPAWNPGSERTFPDLGPKLTAKQRRQLEQAVGHDEEEEEETPPTRGRKGAG